MSTETGMSDLFKAHQTGQEKYAYFILAAAGAAIGFAVQKTEGLILSWWLLPVAGAVICWLGSFYCGCKHLEWIQAAIGANYTLLQLQKGVHPNQPPHDELVGAAKKGVNTAITSNSEKAGKYGIWQFRLLILGATLFLCWRVADMVRITCLA